MKVYTKRRNKRKFTKLWKMFKLNLFKYEVGDLKYRRLLNEYFLNTEWEYKSTITYVKVYKYFKQTIIEIETHRPGLLIGKSGHYIDALEDYLKYELENDNIKIDLKECLLWHNLYKK